MRYPSRISCLLIAVLLQAVLAFSQSAVTTWHYDNARTGANIGETKLAPGTLDSSNFGKLYSQPVDGAIVGQALYLPNITVAGSKHNVVYVATMHDSVYAFDADNATGANAAPLWHTSFLSKGVTPIPIKMQKCGGTTRWDEVGVLSTPVIDPASGTIYVVAKTLENKVQIHRLHALDVATGLEKAGSPVKITASYVSNGQTYTFADAFQVNRPALMLLNGRVYIAFGSNGCRGSKEQGWVVSYDAKTLRNTGAFDTEPGSSGAGFWQKGGGLSADSKGNIYGETADGPFTAGKNFGLSVLKLKRSGATLQLADWFTPYNLRYLNSKDSDLDVPVLILPDQPGGHPHLALGVGKEGTVYVLDRDNMGHFCTTCTTGNTQIVQDLESLVGKYTGALAYWNGIVYSSAVAAPINAYALAGGQLATTPVAQSATAAGEHSPVVSANGNTSGILWQINHADLTAYDALNLKKLYSSKDEASGRDLLPDVPHFGNLMVANGKVYVGASSALVAYGLLDDPQSHLTETGTKTKALVAKVARP
jgi:hypothetical protein